MFYYYAKMSKKIVTARFVFITYKKWQFLGTRAPPSLKKTPAAGCSFTGHASQFGAGKATLKIVVGSSIEYHYFIISILFILFILLMLSKRIKEINKKVYIGVCRKSA